MAVADHPEGVCVCVRLDASGDGARTQIHL